MKIREGVVLAEICGQYRLIASWEARKYCPVIADLNESSAYVWKLLQKGASLEEMAEKTAADFSMEKEAAEEILKTFLQQLSDRGYLL